MSIPDKPEEGSLKSPQSQHADSQETSIIEAAQSLRVTLRWLSDKADPSPDKVWDDALFRLHVIADGFASSSYPKGQGFRAHWLYTLKDKILEADPLSSCIGFSYSAPGFQYPPRLTKIDFRRAVRDKIPAYWPVRHWPVTYHAFSLAGPLFVLGLARWARTLRSPDLPSTFVTATSQASEQPKRYSLILVQPAFLLSESATLAILGPDEDHDTKGGRKARDIERKKSVGPGGAATAGAAIAEEVTAEEATESVEIVASSLNALAVASRKFREPDFRAGGQGATFLRDLMGAFAVLSQHMNVRILYWREDKFLVYPDRLLDQLRDAGVIPEELLNLSFPPSNREGTALRLFQKHSMVAIMPETTTRIQELIVQLLRR